MAFFSRSSKRCWTAVYSRSRRVGRQLFLMQALAMVDKNELLGWFQRLFWIEVSIW